MKVNFSNQETAPVIDVESSPVDATAPAEAIPTAPANSCNLPVPIAAPPNSFNDEEISFEDLILPRINVVQGVGDLSTIFNPGEIVLNQSLVVHVPANPLKKITGHPPLSFTVIGFKRRQFVEKTVGGAMGNLVNSEAEVVKAGGTLDYNEAKATGKPLYQRLATALILVEKPAHIPDDERFLFPHTCEGRWYVLALWSLKGTGYTNAAKPIYTARKLGHLKSGYPAQAWFLTTKLQEYSGNFAHIPVLTAGAKNTPAFAEFVKEVLSSGN